MDSERIRAVAKDLDDTLETKDNEKILEFFADDCEVQMLGVTLRGKGGVKKWLDWKYLHVSRYVLVPVVIMIEGSVFFEEFVVKAKLHDGTELESNQAEVIVYDEQYKVKSLRLYFDRLDFAGAVARDPISKFIVRMLVGRSLKGLS